MDTSNDRIRVHDIAVRVAGGIQRRVRSAHRLVDGDVLLLLMELGQCPCRTAGNVRIAIPLRYDGSQ